MMAFYLIDSILKQSQMVADRRDPRGVMFTGLTPCNEQIAQINPTKRKILTFLQVNGNCCIGEGYKFTPRKFETTPSL